MTPEVDLGPLFHIHVHILTCISAHTCTPAQNTHTPSPPPITMLFHVKIYLDILPRMMLKWQNFREPHNNGVYFD